MDVPTNLEDLEAAARKLGDSGAHHSYIDEVMNAVAEIKELRSEAAIYVRAINEMREQFQAIGDVATAFRRMPIRDLSEVNIRKSQ